MGRKKKEVEEETQEKLEPVLLPKKQKEHFQTLLDSLGILQDGYNKISKLEARLDSIEDDLILEGKISSPNLQQKVLQVMDKVRGVAEDAKHQMGYSFASHDAVANVLHGAMVDAGITVSTSIEEHDIKQMDKGYIMSVVKVGVKFINADNPSDTDTVYSYGYGWDKNDKGIGKAVSYAIKYAYLKKFVLPTGEDTDFNDFQNGDTGIQRPVKENGSKKAREDKLEAIRTYIGNSQDSPDLVKSKLVEQAYRIDEDNPNSPPPDEALEKIKTYAQMKTSEWSEIMVDKIYNIIN